MAESRGMDKREKGEPAARWLATPADAWALVALVALVLVFSLPLFAHPGRMRDPENGDSLNYYLHLELARRSILHYGQFPWWTPYVRGGLPLVGHPRDVSLSPVLLPALLLPPVAAVKVICTGIYLVGALGMYYLTRVVLGLARTASVAAAIVFVASVWLPARLVSGNYDEWHLVLFPLVVGLYLRSRRAWRYTVYGALVLYVTIMDGKYVVALFGLFLGLAALAEAVVLLGRRRGTRALRPLACVAVMFTLAALLATVKIVPMTQLMGGGKATVVRPLIVAPQTIEIPLFDLTPFDWTDDNFGTNINHLGTWFIAPLLFVLACVAAARRMVGWLALLVVSLVLMHSGRVPRWMDLFALLHRLPIFEALKYPFKYFNFFVLFAVCVGTAEGLTWIGRRAGRGRNVAHPPLPSPSPSPSGRGERGEGPPRSGAPHPRSGLPLAAAVAAVVTAAVPFVWDIRLNERLFSAEAKGPPAPQADEFYSLAGYHPAERLWDFRMFKDFFFVRQGVGVLNWYDPMDLPCHAIPRYNLCVVPGPASPGRRHRPVERYEWAENRPASGEDAPRTFLEGFLGQIGLGSRPAWRGEVYLAGGGRIAGANARGQAAIRPGTWSPLGFTVDLTDAAPGDVLVVNQNYDPRWRASVGEVTQEGGRLAVRLPAGFPRPSSSAGATSVRLRYRPLDHYLAACVSGLTFVGCVAALIVGRRRRLPGPQGAGLGSLEYVAHPASGV